MWRRREPRVTRLMSVPSTSTRPAVGSQNLQARRGGTVSGWPAGGGRFMAAKGGSKGWGHQILRQVGRGIAVHNVERRVLSQRPDTRRPEGCTHRSSRRRMVDLPLPASKGREWSSQHLARCLGWCRAPCSPSCGAISEPSSSGRTCGPHQRQRAPAGDGKANVVQHGCSVRRVAVEGQAGSMGG